MGIAIVDDRASGGDLRERQTTTCVHCSTIIIYQSKFLKGQVRRVRTSYNPQTGQRIEEIGEGFFCQRHQGDICKYCGDKAYNGVGPCVSMESIAEATVTAINQGIDIWTPQGQVHVQVKATQRHFLGV